MAMITLADLKQLWQNVSDWATGANNTYSPKMTPIVNGAPVSDANPLPTTATIQLQSVEVTDVSVKKTLVELDSSLSPLPANGTYTTASPFNMSIYDKLVGTVYADQPGTLSIQQSWDGSNWDEQSTISISANSGQGFEIDVIAPFGRVVYTNGSTAQTVFRLYVGGKR
jgi:hypothetical protein